MEYREKMLKAKEIPLRPTHLAIDGFTFGDTFVREITDTFTAQEIAMRALNKSPQWVDRLMTIRNQIVSPFGLKHGFDDFDKNHEFIGMFPIEYKSENLVVLGFDDKHLDFRIYIETETIEAGMRVFATTLVKTKNFLGRAYLFTIMPFHKLIVKNALNQV